MALSAKQKLTIIKNYLNIGFRDLVDAQYTNEYGLRCHVFEKDYGGIQKLFNPNNHTTPWHFKYARPLILWLRQQGFVAPDDLFTRPIASDSEFLQLLREGTATELKHSSDTIFAGEHLRVASASEWHDRLSALEHSFRNWKLSEAQSIVESANDPVSGILLEAISLFYRGNVQFGLPTFEILEKSRNGQSFVQTLPSNAQLDFLLYSGRFYSIAGNQPRTQTQFQKIRQFDLLGKLSDAQRVALVRSEIVALLNSANTIEAYNGQDQSVYRRVRPLLKHCLRLTGTSLDSARRFDPAHGPALLCVRDTFEAMKSFGARDKIALRSALAGIERGLAALYDTDKFVGIIRYTPLANLYLRTGEINMAHETLLKQIDYWSFDPDPAANNSFEFSACLILLAIVEILRHNEDQAILLVDRAATVLETSGNRGYLTFLERLKKNVDRMAFDMPEDIRQELFGDSNRLSTYSRFGLW